MHGPHRRGARLAVVTVLAAEALVFTLDVSVTVQGSPHYVTSGTTLVDVAHPWVATMRSGNLVDVEGRVLKRGVFPPRILRNGKATRRGTILRPGDEVRIVRGPDHTEPVVKESFEVFGSERSNPQFHIGVVSGRLVVSKGVLSGKLASLEYAQRRQRSSPDEVALTFDDGPHPRYTKQVLRILRRYRAPATFFVVGARVAAYPELVQAEVDAGMTIGDHSWDHPQKPSFAQLSPSKMRAQIDSVREPLMEKGITPYLFRPPGGAYSPQTIATAQDLGMRTVLWTVDPKDWRPGAKSSRIVKFVLDHVTGGSIVLLHDGGGKREATVKALPHIIKGIRRKGLRLVAIRP